LGSYLYRTQVRRDLEPAEFLALQQELFAVLESAPENLIPLMAKRLGEDYLTVHDVFQEEKESVFRDLLFANHEEAVAAVAHHFMHDQATGTAHHVSVVSDAGAVLDTFTA
jgi:hypothetical protein